MFVIVKRPPELVDTSPMIVALEDATAESEVSRVTLVNSSKEQLSHESNPLLLVEINKISAGSPIKEIRPAELILGAFITILFAAGSVSDLAMLIIFIPDAVTLNALKSLIDKPLAFAGFTINVWPD